MNKQHFFLQILVSIDILSADFWHFEHTRVD